MPKSSRSILIPVLAVLAVVLALFFFLSENRETIKKAPAAAEPSAGEGGAAADVRLKRKVDLLFLSEESDALIREEREIFADASPAREAREILLELIKGSQTGLLSTVPPETRLIQVYIDKEGTAFVDLSREFADRHPSGSSAEIATVYAVVDTLASNIASVKKVFILIDGEERETLSGHVALDRPIAPDYSLVAGRS